jgi:hypothetical protein
VKAFRKRRIEFNRFSQRRQRIVQRIGGKADRQIRLREIRIKLEGTVRSLSNQRTPRRIVDRAEK